MGGSLARAAAVALGALSVSSPHVASAATHALDLKKDAATVFTTHAPDFSLGGAVAPAGDVNGDGNADVLIAAPDAGRNGRRGSGSAYVVFGKPSFAPRMPLDPLGGRGFRIDGAPPELRVHPPKGSFDEGRRVLRDNAGYAVAGVGDANGDGLDDVAVSALDASPHGRVAAGAVYVVFGKRSSSSIDLKRLGDRGYRIAGARREANAGFVLAAPGDINGDGRADLLVGTYFSSLGPSGGAAYAVFGQSEPRPVDLAHLGAAGIVIRGPWTAGPEIGALGDVNEDGLADMIVGASPTTKDGEGHAYVIFGRSAPGNLRLGKLGSGGYSIRDSSHALAGDLGGLVAGPGDVNGDGRPDLLIGGGDVTHVLFSDASGKDVDLRRAAGRQIAIRGFDISVAPATAGDANGDGLADVLIGDPYRAARCVRSAGTATVVYGRRDPADLRVANLGAAGYRIDGAAEEDNVGDALAWAGDLDGDGHSDILLGAPGAGRHGRAFVVTGRSGGVPTPPRGPCLSVRVPRQSLTQVVRTGRIRVVVARRSTGSVLLIGFVKHHGLVAQGDLRFRSPGTRVAHLKLTPRGRALLRSRRRVRLHVKSLDIPFETPRASTSAVLSR